jgi:DNA-directed RNA polymerase specialized sigma24 family protein
LIPRAYHAVDEDQMEPVGRSRLLRRSIGAPPELYRAVLTLRAQHQTTIPAIARALHIPIKTAGMRAARAIKVVRATLFR